MRKIRIALTFLLGLLLTVQANAMSNEDKLKSTVVTRGSLDIGSGSVKIKVADVDPLNGKIVKVHYSDAFELKLSEDLSQSSNSTFSKNIQDALFQKLEETNSLLTKQYGPIQWQGVATSASRNAKNAQVMFNDIENKLGINIRIIDQDEEAYLGFETVVALASDIPRHSLISYDTGSGSFQVATEINHKLKSFNAELGLIPAFKIFFEEIRNETFIGQSPNPVTEKEASQLAKTLRAAIPTPSLEIKNKISEPNSVVVLTSSSVYSPVCITKVLGKEIFSKDELWNVIVNHCNKTDEEFQSFPYPNEAIVEMVLIHGVMSKLNINQITVKEESGICFGILVSDQYWASNQISFEVEAA